jgi:hypothetical protein
MEVENSGHHLIKRVMKANTVNRKEEEQTNAQQDFEKSELMQLFESELRNAYRGHVDLINAILEEE